MIKYLKIAAILLIASSPTVTHAADAVVVDGMGFDVHDSKGGSVTFDGFATQEP